MGKFKQSGGYDKVIRSKKYIDKNPPSQPKITKESIYPKKKVQFNLNPQGPTNHPEQHDTNSDSTKKSKSIISSVQFKATKKQDKKSTFLKLKDTTSKYLDIKQSLLKQINSAESPSVGESPELGAPQGDSNKLNFVARPKAKLTNAVLKRILNQTPAQGESKVLKPIAKGKTPQLTDFVGTSRKINKKAKSIIKKNLWSQKIDLIKNQFQDAKDKVKREKSVITGDMRPMLDSLNEEASGVTTFSSKKTLDEGLTGLVSLLANKVNKLVDSNDLVTSNLPADPKKTTKKERRAKNLANEQAKSIQKQSIRFKKSQDDISLFGQLLDYKEFTSNPLELLKKHFKN